jgi:hypothetical protein
MELRDIISTLMMSDFYFSLPLRERKDTVLRLFALYGQNIDKAVSWGMDLSVMSDNYVANRPEQC